MNQRKDKIINCQQCQQAFVWTQEEQEFYQQKKLGVPKFCPVCRSLLKEAKKDKFRGKIG